MFVASRYHDISCGHRGVGHENKCKHLHGHNYRVHFDVTSNNTDELGRVVDFSVIKSDLCMWLEDNWDHKMLIWCSDPLLEGLQSLDNSSIVVVPFNPTAENMAKYLVEVIGPAELSCKSLTLSKVTIEETMKCSATYYKD